MSEQSEELPEEASCEVIGEGRWLRLVRRGRWEYAQRTVGGTAAIIVALTDADELVLIEQSRPALEGRVCELPAGLIGDDAGSEDEDPAVAAGRELQEETGYVAAELERLTQGPSTPGLSDEQLIVFRARGLRKVGEGGGIDHEDISVHLVPLAEVPSWLAARAAAGVHIDIKVWAGLYWANS